jgi:hypothetical protein
MRGRAGHIGFWWFALILRSTIVSGLWVDFDEANNLQSGARESWGRVGRGKLSLLLAVAAIIGGDGNCRKTAVVLFLPQSWCEVCEDATVGRVHDLMDGRWEPVVVVVLKELVRCVHTRDTCVWGTGCGWVAECLPGPVPVGVYPTRDYRQLSHHTNVE